MVAAPQQPSTIVCTHERRPGTTVCLHCRHAERIAARAKRKRLLLRASAAGVVIATFAIALGAKEIRDRGSRAASAGSSGGTLSATPAGVADSGKPESRPESAAPASQPVAQPVVAPPPVAQQGGSEKRSAAPLVPVIPAGESPVTQGVTATRVDSAVMLSFDSPLVRTRIPEKFEELVRATLPAIYGHGVDSVLAKLPAGAIARQGNLLSELPSRGVRIPIGAGWTIQLFPETRAGQDGPLVVRYRVSVVPATD